MKMDMLNIILDPYKLKSSCFLCFKCSENMSNLLQKFAVYVDYKTFEMRLKDLIFYLFPTHDVLCDQACSECIDLLLKMFTLLHRNHMKKSIIIEILTQINNELKVVDTNKLSNIDRLQVSIKVPDYDELRSKEVINLGMLKFDKLDDTVLHQDVTTKCISCTECHMTFLKQETLRKHKKVAHSNKFKAAICEYCGKDCKKTSTLKAHLNSHKNSTCPYCFKVLKSHSYFKLHVKSHETQVKVSRKRTKMYYNCDTCSFKSLNTHSLEAHVNKVHLQIRPYVCDICNKTFYRKTNLVEHIAIHSKNNHMTCEYCGDKFLYKKTLLDHLKLHSGEKPFECEICKQRFVTSGRRTEHFKRKHMEKRVVCLLCGKMFSMNSELNTHLKKYHGEDSNGKKCMMLDKL